MADSLKEIIEKKFKRHPVLGELIREENIFKNWAGVVGDSLAAAAKPLYLKKGTLTLAVVSPAWHQEIGFLKEKIVSEINRYLGGSFVKSVKCLVTGEREFKEIGLKSPGLEDRPDWYWPEKNKKNPDLKNLLVRLERMDQKLKEWRRQKKIKTCPICGCAFGSPTRLCPSCRSREYGRGFKKIINLVRQYPEKSLKQLKKNWPGLDEADFKKARQLVLEEGEKIIRFFKYETGTALLKRKLAGYQEKLLIYVALRVGQAPDKIERNLMKKILGDKIYYHLKNSL